MGWSYHREGLLPKGFEEITPNLTDFLKNCKTESFIKSVNQYFKKVLINFFLNTPRKLNLDTQRPVPYRSGTG